MPNEFIVKNGLISQGNITISGSITATGGVTVSGSIASASYASNAELLDGLDSTVFTLTSSFNAQTASFTAFTSSMNSFSASILTNVTALNAKTASFATTGSNTFVGAEVISGSLAISGSGTPFTLNTDTLEITGSLIVTGSTTLTGSLLQLGNFTTTGTIIAQTINVQTVTSSIVYSSGSNVFGNSIGNSQTFTGSVLITGSLTIAGASSATSYSGTTIYGSTVACSPIGCFATSCATSFIGGTMSGTTIYGSTAVCSPVGCFATSCATSFIGGTMSGTCIIVSSKIIVGGTSGDIGSDLLRVKGTIITDNNAGYLGYSSAGNRFELAKISSGDEIVLGASNSPGAVALISGTGQDLILRSNGTCERIRITSTGNVGIGINNPGAKLQVKTSTSAGATDAFYIENTSSALFEVRDDGLIYMKGNVGIGCTTPGTSLTIQSTGVTAYLKTTATADSPTYGNFQMYRGTCKVGNGVGFALGLLNSAAVDTEYAYIGTLIESCTSTQECGAIGFYTTTAGSGRCERMRISSTGYVGINVTSACKHLEVGGTIRTTVSPSVYYRDVSYIGDNYQFGSSETSDNVDFKICGGSTWATGGNFRWFTQAGNSTPTEKMRIASTGTVTFACDIEFGSMRIFNGNAVGTKTITTSAVTLQATSQYGGGNTGNLSLVSGIIQGNGGIGFVDVVLWMYGGSTPTVIASQTTGSPAGRTYSISASANLQLAMASGTYFVSSNTFRQSYTN